MTRAVDLAKRAVITTEDLTNIPSGAKNLIINGDMRIAQRGTSVSGLQNSPAYLVDRWSYRRLGTWSTASFTYSQISSTGLAYFDNAIRFTVSGTETPSSDTCARIDQWIEGNIIKHLELGTSNAKSLTLSFWVRSSLAGIFNAAASSENGSACFVSEYTINSANTWEKKTISIDAATIGTFNSGNTTGFRITFTFAADLSSTQSITSTTNEWISGSYICTANQTNLAGTNGATFDITGVQLEVGDTATPFEHRPWDMELARCQRYYEKSFKIDVAPSTSAVNNGGNIVGSGNAYHYPANPTRNFSICTFYKVRKRAVPSVQRYSHTSTGAAVSHVFGGGYTSFAFSVNDGSETYFSGESSQTGANEIIMGWTAEAEL